MKNYLDAICMMVLVRDVPRRTVLVNYVSTTLAEVTVSQKFETPVNNISPFLSRLPLTLSIAFHAYLKANPPRNSSHFDENCSIRQSFTVCILSLWSVCKRSNLSVYHSMSLWWQLWLPKWIHNSNVNWMCYLKSGTDCNNRTATTINCELIK